MTPSHALALGAALAALALAAAVQASDEDHAACMEEAGGVTVEMLDCIGAAYGRADDRLNALYGELREDLFAEAAELLVEAQRGWIAYRDSTCAAEAAVWGGGSFAGVALADCRLRITAERVNWLENLLPEGR